MVINGTEQIFSELAKFLKIVIELKYCIYEEWGLLSHELGVNLFSIISALLKNTLKYNETWTELGDIV